MEPNLHPVILIVDDQPELISVMSMYLKYFGYHHFTAHSAVAALDILDKEKVDLVICDLVMPFVGGLELLKKVRQTRENAPHFIFCSGLCDVPFTVPYPEGVLGFVQKPFSMTELMDKVAVHLRQLATT